jgi:hypothetical protein
VVTCQLHASQVENKVRLSLLSTDPLLPHPATDLGLNAAATAAAVSSVHLPSFEEKFAWKLIDLATVARIGEETKVVSGQLPPSIWVCVKQGLGMTTL